MNIREATPEEEAAAKADFNQEAWDRACEAMERKERRDATGFPDGKPFGILDTPYE